MPRHSMEGAVLKLPNRKISKSFNNYSDSGRGASRANDFVTKRCSGFGTGQKRMLLATRQNVGSNPQPMPVSQSRFVPLEALPGSRRGGASFCVHRREGAATARTFGAFATFVKERAKREGRVRRFRGRASGSLRCAGWCKYAGTKGAARFARTARFGLRGRRRPTLSGLPDAQGLVLAGRRWAENPAAALLDHCTPREAAKLFGELGGMNPSSSHALVRQAVSGRKESGRPWTREAETGEAVSCSVSLDGVPLRPDGDEEACWASCGTVSFQGAEGRKRSVLGRKPARRRRNSPKRSLTSARCGPNWLPSPTPRLTTGRFSKSSGPTNKRSTFFMHSEVSDRREQLEVPSRPARRRRRQGRRSAISATRRRRNRRFSGANSGFSASTDAACVTRTSRPTAARSGVVRQQGPGQPAHGRAGA